MPALEGADLPRNLAPLDLKRSEDPFAAQPTSKSATDKEQVKTARVVAIASPVATSSARNGSSESLASSRSSNSRPSSVSGPHLFPPPQDALSNHTIHVLQVPTR